MPHRQILPFIARSISASLGFGVDPEASEFNPLTLVEGAWAREDDEVVIDAGTAESEGYAVGDQVPIQTLQPVRSAGIALPLSQVALA